MKDITYRESFVKHLLSSTNMKQHDFDTNRYQVVNFRNNFIAHKGIYNNPVPNFDMACDILFCFDDWIRQHIKPDILDFPNLRDLIIIYKKDIFNTLQKLI